MSNINATRFAACLLLLFCVAVYAVVVQYPADAALFPEMLVVSLGVASIVMIFRSYQVEAYKKPLLLANKKQVTACAALAVTYTVCIGLLGYYLSSALFILAMAVFLRFKGTILALSVAALYPLSIYIVFEVLLNIPIPRGMFG